MDNVKKFCNRAILIDGGKILEDGDPKKVADDYTKMLLG